MSKIKVVLNRENVRNLLKSEWIMGECKQQAEAIASRADGNYEVTTYVGKNRCTASVITRDKETYRKNLEENTLLKGM